ncbi:hypothetical protein EMGR_005259 [Emarellia grisea]|jgi:hypothetical protein
MGGNGFQDDLQAASANREHQARIRDIGEDIILLNPELMPSVGQHRCLEL